VVRTEKRAAVVGDALFETAISRRLAFRLHPGPQISRRNMRMKRWTCTGGSAASSKIAPLRPGRLGSRVRRFGRSRARRRTPSQPLTYADALGLVGTDSPGKLDLLAHHGGTSALYDRMANLGPVVHRVLAWPECRFTIRGIPHASRELGRRPRLGAAGARASVGAGPQNQPRESATGPMTPPRPEFRRALTQAASDGALAGACGMDDVQARAGFD
jgi:hypothetical protein